MMPHLTVHLQMSVAQAGITSDKMIHRRLQVANLLAHYSPIAVLTLNIPRWLVVLQCPKPLLPFLYVAHGLATRSPSEYSGSATRAQLYALDSALDHFASILDPAEARPRTSLAARRWSPSGD